MFTEELHKGCNQHIQPHKLIDKVSKTEPFLPQDLGYEICSSFLKLTGERLSNQELSMLEASRCMLEWLSSRRMDAKEIDSSRTLDTYLEDSMGLQDEPSLGALKGRSIGSRRNGQAMMDQLREIQERCSQGCFMVVSNWVAEYKTMESKLRFYEGREGSRREEWSGRLEEQNLILRKRVEFQEVKLKQMSAEIQQLKEKNKTLGINCSVDRPTLQHSNRYFEINHRVYRDIKNYLSDRQLLLKQQSQRIAQHEAQVIAAIQAPFADSACARCCQIIRKLKEAILKFRGYLEGQSQQFQRLYDRYKKTMYAVKARPSV